MVELRDLIITFMDCIIGYTCKSLSFLSAYPLDTNCKEADEMCLQSTLIHSSVI